MTLKDQEQQLSTSLITQLALSLVLWLTIAGLVGYQLFRLSLTTVPQPTSKSSLVPTLEQDKISALRTSVKTPPTGSRPIIRPEPFD